MKRFKNSLQRVLDVREVVVTQCEAMLAESKRQLQLRQIEERHVQNELNKASEHVVQTISANAQSNRDCLVQRAWIAHLSDSKQKAAVATRQENQHVEERREKLTQAMMEHKVIENLSRRKRLEWMEEVRQAEQKVMDEVAASTLERRRHAKRGQSSPDNNTAGIP